MNYREFTERVYNYKHGLTNSAESQNIEHSAKEENNVLGENNSPEDNIMHSKLGDEWDQHKYIRKEYLGNNNWRYIYADGSSNVTNAANETQADEAESRSRATQIRSTNKANYQAEQERKNAGTPNAQTSQAIGIGQHLSNNVQSPSNQSFVEARGAAYQENQRKDASAHDPSAAPSIKAREGEDLPWQKIQGTKAETERKLASNINNEPITTPALEKAIADTAVRNQAATASGIAAERAAAGTPSGETPDNLHKAMTESEIRANGPRMSTEEAMRQGTASSVNTTRNQQAENILWDYSKEVNTIRSELADAGYDENTIMNLIRSTETRAGGESIIDQLYNYNPNTQSMVFFPGAEVGLKSYTDSVLPALKDMANTMIESKKISDITSKLTPEEYSFLEEYYQKIPVTVNDNNVTTWDNVPTQTFDNSNFDDTWARLESMGVGEGPGIATNTINGIINLKYGRESNLNSKEARDFYYNADPDTKEAIMNALKVNLDYYQKIK